MNSPARFPTPPPLPGGALARFPPPPPPPPLPFQQIAQQQQPLLLGTPPPFTLDSWTPWIVIAITSTLAITILTLFIYVSFSTSHEDNAKEKSAREKERRLKEEKQEEEQEERREELAALKRRVKQQEDTLAQLEKNYSDHLEKMSQRMKENEDTLTLVAMTMSMRDQGQKEQKEKLDAALAKIPRPAREISFYADPTDLTPTPSCATCTSSSYNNNNRIMVEYLIYDQECDVSQITKEASDSRLYHFGTSYASPKGTPYDTTNQRGDKVKIYVPLGNKIKLVKATWNFVNCQGQWEYSECTDSLRNRHRHLFDE